MNEDTDKIVSRLDQRASTFAPIERGRSAVYAGSLTEPAALPVCHWQPRVVFARLYLCGESTSPIWRATNGNLFPNRIRLARKDQWTKIFREEEEMKSFLESNSIKRFQDVGDVLWFSPKGKMATIFQNNFFLHLSLAKREKPFLSMIFWPKLHKKLVMFAKHFTKYFLLSGQKSTKIMLKNIFCFLWVTKITKWTGRDCFFGAE